MRVLVVDDYPDATDATVALLALLGHSARGVYTGAGALAAFGDFRPDVVVLDLSLPDLSGYEVARTLRARGALAFLAAVTGWSAPVDRAEARAAGFDFFTVKPFSIGSLGEILRLAGERGT